MKGVCKICGCTWNTPCYTHKEGYCWWIDEKEEICSHCYYGFSEPDIEDLLIFSPKKMKNKRW